MVNRYDADGCQSAVGNYVSYEDYERLKQEFMDYVYSAEKTKDSLMRQVDEAIRGTKRND